MNSIFDIERSLYDIYQQIEENDGILTPELDEALAITKDSFDSKVENYVKLIKHLDNDMKAISNEIDRLSSLSKTKQRIIEKLNNIIIQAINLFGDTKSSGVKYLSTPTFNVSIRKSKALDVNKDAVKGVSNAITYYIRNSLFYNTLNEVSKLKDEDIKNAVNDYVEGDLINDEDLNNIRVELSTKINLAELTKEDGYALLKNIVKYNSNYNVDCNIPKSEIKEKMKDNTELKSNLFELKENQSLIIK